MLTAGIDIGSTITKIVIKNRKETLSSVIQRTGAEHRRRAHRIMGRALGKAGLVLNDLDYIMNGKCAERKELSVRKKDRRWDAATFFTTDEEQTVAGSA